jgi:glucose/arabinose dehydrogenase
MSYENVPTNGARIRCESDTTIGRRYNCIVRNRSPLVAMLTLALLAGACTSKKPSASPTPSASSPSPTPTMSSASPSPSPSQSKKSSPKPATSSTAPKPSTPKPAGFDLAAVRIRLTTFKSGLSNPVFITSANDGSGLLYIVQQGGTILVVDSAGRTKSTLLNISSKISTGNEQGLLGLAFHPSFESNRRFFVHYTRSDGDIVIAEYHANSTTSADASSEKVITTIEHSTYSNHNGGMLVFGPDGFLYDGTGDGGSGGDPNNNAQNTSRLLGKILRIDVNHGTNYVPSSNPFGNLVWNYGLRNPWRFSFDRSTHALFIGDVGQNTYEEIDVTRSGRRNFGWRVMEGKHCYSASTCDRTGKTLPITEYTHGGGNCSVTGGYVYRGSSYRTLKGAYFYGDYCSGKIWAMDAAAAIDGRERVRMVLDTSLSISSFGENQAGEIFVCSLGGTIYRLRAA